MQPSKGNIPFALFPRLVLLPTPRNILRPPLLTVRVTLGPRANVSIRMLLLKLPSISRRPLNTANT